MSNENLKLKKNELECVVFPKQEPTNTPSFIPFPHARIGTCIEEKMPLGSTLTTLKCRVHDNLDAEMCSTYASFVDRHEFVFDSGLKMLHRAAFSAGLCLYRNFEANHTSLPFIVPKFDVAKEFFLNSGAVQH